MVVAMLIALFGFWRLAPGVTFLIACGALIVCLVAFWIAGRGD
jgi:hypothetical protein